MSSQVAPAIKNTKSWYDQTIEEEEEALAKDEDLTKCNPTDQVIEVEDPYAEKILDDEDWAEDDGTCDENDLMDEDDLLLEEEEEEKESELLKEKTSLSSDAPSWWKGSPEPEISKEEKVSESQNLGAKDRIKRSPTTGTGTSESSKKKKGTPSPLTAALSLKKRNFLLGRASPNSGNRSGKAKNGKAKNGKGLLVGPSSAPLGPVPSQPPDLTKKAHPVQTKSAKVVHNKPPKILK